MTTSNTFRKIVGAAALTLSMGISAPASAGWFWGGSSSTTTITETQVQAAVEKIGRFAGSVGGLRYETESGSGFTGADGSFEYVEGETISFFLGDTLIGKVKASSLVSALDMVTKNDHPDKLQNLLRVLDAIDADGNASNGVEVTDAADQYLQQFPLQLNNPARIFEGSQVVMGLVNAFTSQTGLKDAIDTFVSFRETLLSERRDTEDEVVLNLVGTKWNGEIKSTACTDQTKSAKLTYNFNILGIATYGYHHLTQTANANGGVDCKASKRGIFFSTYETDVIFACANECTAADLNRVIMDEDEFGEIATTISYSQDQGVMQIHTTYFNAEGSQTETVVLTKR